MDRPGGSEARRGAVKDMTSPEARANEPSEVPGDPVVPLSLCLILVTHSARGDHSVAVVIHSLVLKTRVPEPRPVGESDRRHLGERGR